MCKKHDCDSCDNCEGNCAKPDRLGWPRAVRLFVAACEKEAERMIAESKISRAGYWYLDYNQNSIVTNLDMLSECVELWLGGTPFWLVRSASAPYDGCFHQPHIWACYPEDDLVEPVHTPSERFGATKPRFEGKLALMELLKFLWDERCGNQMYRGAYVYEWGPLNDHVDVTYALSAVSRSERDLDLDLPWRCTACGDEFEGEDEGAPWITETHGLGGIAIGTDTMICNDCRCGGMCPACEARGASTEDGWSQEVYDATATICEWCEDALWQKVDPILTESVEALLDEPGVQTFIRIGVRNPQQASFTVPGMEPALTPIVMAVQKGKPDRVIPAEDINIDGFEDELRDILGYDGEHIIRLMVQTNTGIPFPRLSRNCNYFDTDIDEYDRYADIQESTTDE